MTISIIEGIQLFMPVTIMMTCFFISGIMGVTSYNIRISATQSYVPDEKRGRFNGIFNMICTAGGILGQLLGGAMAEFASERTVTVIFAIFNVLAVVFVMYRGRDSVKKIYNRKV
jgi:MFS family permease